ncbi:MAG: ATP-binding cassette domain-containing protein [Lachnospiraceae bacterium]|nr:ATP-binding cassette domain-containing protein [Lachnospiraceae bacterium]
MEILQIRNLSFSYPNINGFTRALTDVNININEGEFVVVCGESGSGKSTLLKLLKPEISPAGKTEGEVWFAGEKLTSENSLSIGYMGQDYELSIVTDRVYQELAFGPENLNLDSGSIRRRISEISSYFGMDEWLNSPTDKLSGGQKQILSLASVLTMRPRVILLDEPMGSLDPVSADRLMGMLRRLNSELGITVVMVEHALEFCLSYASRLIVLKNGRVFYDGEPANAIGTVKNERIFEAFPAVAKLVDRFGIEGWDGQFTVLSAKKYLEGKPHRDVLRETSDEASGEEVLKAKDIYYAYERKSPFIVRGASISLNAGETLAVLGGNGSGKSTFIKTLCGINKPQRGRVSAQGSVAYLPQDTKLAFLKDSVRADYESYVEYMGLDSAVIADISRKLGIEELLDRHPYDLSGGQRALAAMGKMFMSNAKIMLFDEPTQGLDMGMKKVIADIFKRLKEEGRCILFVTHDTVFAQMASDKAYMFFDGGITEPEKTHRFFRENNYYTTPARLIAGDVDAVSVDEIIKAYS